MTDSVSETRPAATTPAAKPAAKAKTEDAAKPAEGLPDKLAADLEAARRQARDLERRLEEGRGEMAAKRLEMTDKLLSVYLMIAGLLTARGDGEGLRHLASQAARMAGRAPGDV